MLYVVCVAGIVLALWRECERELEVAWITFLCCVRVPACVYILCGMGSLIAMGRIAMWVIFKCLLGWLILQLDKTYVCIYVRNMYMYVYIIQLHLQVDFLFDYIVFML